MRIENKLSIPREQASRGMRQASKLSFSQTLHQQEARLHEEAVSDLISTIDRAGDELVQHRTIAHLLAYKKLIRQLLEEAQRGLKWVQRDGTYARGRIKVYHLIEQVDARLLQLTEELLESEADHLELLALVGEIKGLLIEWFG